MKELALHILDIAENCIAAGAGRVIITVKEEEEGNFLCIRIEDNGKGMSEKETGSASDPFYTSRTTRRVGMGIPLFRQHAEMAGGGLKIHSEKGIGTTVEATFLIKHPDRQPLGDLEGSWLLLVVSNPAIEWELKCKTGNGNFAISTSQIRQELGLECIGGNELSTGLKRMIRNNLDELGLN
ncbi:MAG: ATP-binding protein [Bacteroidales bacterium]|nr:ATP-binding protein [Bacteroidales bacterium]